MTAKPETQADLVLQAKAGQRIHTKHSLFSAPAEGKRCNFHRWRVIACNGNEDVVECHQCGAQSICRCIFDEECS